MTDTSKGFNSTQAANMEIICNVCNLWLNLRWEHIKPSVLFPFTMIKQYHIRVLSDTNLKLVRQEDFSQWEHIRTPNLTSSSQQIGIPSLPTFQPFSTDPSLLIFQTSSFPSKIGSEENRKQRWRPPFQVLSVPQNAVILVWCQELYLLLCSFFFPGDRHRREIRLEKNPTLLSK